MERDRLFGRSRAARLLALNITHGKGGLLGQDGMDGRELEEIIDEEKWLDNWSSGVCELMGVRPDDPEWDACKRNVADSVLGSESVLGSMREVASSTSSGSSEGCLACESDRSKMADIAETLGSDLVERLSS